MIIKIEDLKDRMIGIYKINYPNGKIYIGLSNDIRRRMWEHNNPLRGNYNRNIQVCEKAILKYGKITEIEILELLDDLSELEEKEEYWIKYYNSSDKKIGYNILKGNLLCYGENSRRSKFTNEQVFDIRKRRFLGESKKLVYKEYYSNISFYSFEKIWLGIGYPNVGEEFLSYFDNIPKSELCRRTANNNDNQKLNKEQILEIRKRYDNGELQKYIFKDFPFVCRTTIQRVCARETYIGIEN